MFGSLHGITVLAAASVRIVLRTNTQILVSRPHGDRPHCASDQYQTNTPTRSHL